MSEIRVKELVTSFNKEIKIDDITLTIPINSHKFDKFAVTVNNDGLVELWPESCVDVGIVYSKHCGFYVASYRNFGYDSEIPVGRIDIEFPNVSDYLNCIWVFVRTHNDGVRIISKDCLTPYEVWVK